MEILLITIVDISNDSGIQQNKKAILYYSDKLIEIIMRLSLLRLTEIDIYCCRRKTGEGEP
jgi:hypothetical protein